MKRSIPLFALALSVVASTSLAADPKRALDEETTLTFIDTPLGDAMQFISDLHRVKVTLGSGAVKETPVTFKTEKTKLRIALDKMLEPLGLAATIKGDHLLIDKRPAKRE